jgi:hypothetical protein
MKRRWLKGEIMIDWKSGDDLGLRLDQVDDMVSDVADIDAMLVEIARVAASYGFKVRGVGSWLSLCLAAAGEEAERKSEK